MAREKRRERSPLLEAQRADPITFLQGRASELAATLQLGSDLASEAVPTVVRALGEGWLRAKCAEWHPYYHGLELGHPVARAFQTGDRHAVERICELALYLRHLASFDGYAEVVSSLREQYDSAFLQLAVAYRIARHGPKIVFEPRSTGGRRGDIRFRWSGHNYQVECYRRAPTPDPLRDVLSFTIMRIMEAADGRVEAVRVLVRMKRVPTSEERLTLEREAIGAVERARGGAAETVDASYATVRVEVIGRDEEPDFDDHGLTGPYADADVFVGAYRVKETELLAPMDGVIRAPIRGRLILWRSQDSVVRSLERLSTLVDRIEAKVTQATADDRDSRRIVVAELTEGGLWASRLPSLRRALSKRIFRNHENVAAVLVVSRERIASGRLGFAGTIMPGDPADPICDAWVRWARDTDFKRDILRGWKRSLAK